MAAVLATFRTLAQHAPDGLVPDETLTIAQRRLLSHYLTPRTGMCGCRVWPVAELFGGEP
ncbi:MAG TPA: hypothetical protein VKV26_16270 [Dehalococcoidia bacterium]|nr:hypothetical protein [Dehalococcoidia bacterium]